MRMTYLHGTKLVGNQRKLFNWKPPALFWNTQMTIALVADLCDDLKVRLDTLAVCCKGLCLHQL